MNVQKCLYADQLGIRPGSAQHRDQQKACYAPYRSYSQWELDCVERVRPATCDQKVSNSDRVSLTANQPRGEKADSERRECEMADMEHDRQLVPASSPELVSVCSPLQAPFKHF